MGGMDTETLTGRELDVAVARAMGWHDVRQWTGTDPGWLGIPPGSKWAEDVPAFSAGNCSGLAPVLSWLAENAPTEEQVDAMGMTRDGPPFLQFARRADGQWWAEYTAVVHYEGPQSVIESALSPTLPAAACRLLVAWAARKGREP